MICVEIHGILRRNNYYSEVFMAKIILTGDRPTGKLHIGHYVGSLRNRVLFTEFWRI